MVRDFISMAGRAGHTGQGRANAQGIGKHSTAQAGQRGRAAEQSEQGSAGRGREGRGGAGQGRAGQGRAGHGRAGQGNTSHIHRHTRIPVATFQIK